METRLTERHGTLTLAIVVRPHGLQPIPPKGGSFLFKHIYIILEKRKEKTSASGYPPWEVVFKMPRAKRTSVNARGGAGRKTSSRAVTKRKVMKSVEAISKSPSRQKARVSRDLLVATPKTGSSSGAKAVKSINTGALTATKNTGARKTKTALKTALKTTGSGAIKSERRKLKKY